MIGYTAFSNLIAGRFDRLLGLPGIIVLVTVCIVCLASAGIGQYFADTLPTLGYIGDNNYYWARMLFRYGIPLGVTLLSLGQIFWWGEHWRNKSCCGAFSFLALPTIAVAAASVMVASDGGDAHLAGSYILFMSEVVLVIVMWFVEMELNGKGPSCWIAKCAHRPYEQKVTSKHDHRVKRWVFITLPVVVFAFLTVVLSNSFPSLSAVFQWLLAIWIAVHWATMFAMPTTRTFQRDLRQRGNFEMIVGQAPREGEGEEEEEELKKGTGQENRPVDVLL